MTAILSILMLAQTGAAELSVAREALRDGLYDIARKYARISGEEDAKAVEVEAYARENDWEKVLELADSGYYRAAALYRTGKPQEAHAELEGKTDDCSLLLLAMIDADAGNDREAIKHLKEISEPGTDVKLVAAESHNRLGNRKEAEKLWRECLPNPYAAMNLGEVQALRDAYRDEEELKMKRRLGLRLGRELIKNGESREEGEELIGKIVHDAPDSDGAQEAMVQLGEQLLADGQNAKASAIFSDILQIWPQAAKDPQVASGRGWASLRMGKVEEALESFLKAETLATNANDRALNLVKAGDCQAQLGRGEEAMVTYRRVLSDYAQTPAASRIKDVVRVRELEDSGKEAYRDYNFAAAQQIFAKVAKADPSRKPTMDFYNVLCLYGLGRDEDAERSAVALGTPEAKLWLAKFYYNAGRWREARMLFAEQGFAVAQLWAARAALAENEFALAISSITRMMEMEPTAEVKIEGMLVQGQALIELARFDEAVLVLERAALTPGIGEDNRQKALIMKADSLFAMGADNPVRYEQALTAYKSLRLGEELTPSVKLQLAFKIGRTLEKLKKLDEALDQYYTQVVLAYRKARGQGVRFDDTAKATFARAGLRLADEYESRGMDRQARQILRLVATSDVPAAEEAEKRIERNKRKGKFL